MYQDHFRRQGDDTVDIMTERGEMVFQLIRFAFCCMVYRGVRVAFTADTPKVVVCKKYA